MKDPLHFSMSQAQTRVLTEELVISNLGLESSVPKEVVQQARHWRKEMTMNEESQERIERIERQMAFIVDQQAQYQAQHEARSAAADERWAEADKRWASTEQSIRALLAIAEIHEREFEGLRESTSELRESTSELRESTKELREAGKATDERLNVLINVVERHISEGHNHQRKEQ
jgi:hypothetical protein